MKKETLPKDKKYDIIICQNLLIHFQDSPDDLTRIIANLISLLGENGKIFTDPVESKTFERYSAGKLQKINQTTLQKI